tara:strand:- start:524 stop:889 length:366 start_codon:yes stop_codon:yes gene_type:complete
LVSKKDSKNEADVLGKLDKVADTLESASSQLSGVVTQQQLDLARDRISVCESDINLLKEGFENLSTKVSTHITEVDKKSKFLYTTYEELESDFAGLRALVLSAFVLSTISLMGLIIFVVVF